MFHTKKNRLYIVATIMLSKLHLAYGSDAIYEKDLLIVVDQSRQTNPFVQTLELAKLGVESYNIEYDRSFEPQFQAVITDQRLHTDDDYQYTAGTYRQRFAYGIATQIDVGFPSLTRARMFNSAVSTTENPRYRVIGSMDLNKNRFGRFDKLNKDIIDINHRVASKEFEKQYQEWKTGVRSIYWAMYFANLQIQRLEKGLNLMNDMEKYTRERFEVGLAPLSDLKRLSVSVKRYENQILSAQKRYDTLYFQLQQTVPEFSIQQFVSMQRGFQDIDYLSIINWVEEISDSILQTGFNQNLSSYSTLVDLYKHSKETNDLIIDCDNNIEAMVNISLSDTAETDDIGEYFNPSNMTIQTSFTLNVTLPEGLRKTRDNKRARNHKQFDAKVNATVNRLDVEWDQGRTQLSQMSAITASAYDSMDLSNEIFEISKDEFANGIISVTELLNTERESISSEIEYIQYVGQWLNQLLMMYKTFDKIESFGTFEQS
jgi:hypothetical protein